LTGGAEAGGSLEVLPVADCTKPDIFCKTPVDTKLVSEKRPPPDLRSSCTGGAGAGTGGSNAVTTGCTGVGYGGV